MQRAHFYMHASCGYLARLSFRKARLEGTDFRGAEVAGTRLIGSTGRYLACASHPRSDWYVFE